MIAKPRTAIYARSATSPNPESIAEQVETCQRYAQEQNWDVVMTASEEGIPGTQPDRPSLLQILNLVSSGRLDIVLADGIARFARDADVPNAIIATCNKNGAQLHTPKINMSAPPLLDPMQLQAHAFGPTVFKL